MTRAEIERYQAHLADRARPQPLALQTQASRIRAVKRWFEWLVERGFLFESPTRGIVETPKGMKKLPAVLTVAEVEKLLQHPNTSTPRGIRDRALLEVLYATGLRRGELVALDLADVDLDRGLVRVRSGKGRKGRVVPMTQAAKRWGKVYVNEVRPRYDRDLRRREVAFWLNRFGERLSGTMVLVLMHEAARAAGITKKAHVHALRHACATHLLQGGADIVTIQKTLGHADPTITSQVYTRVYPKDLQDEHRRTHPRERESREGEREAKPPTKPRSPK